ncbi:hypothetical protein NC653_009025 [Populus alba x Populus x berolinensis]|uniref:Uncharacterized protein n=1 Tax=Populus alba x Populus x berolinensis TaxID=444605 RepID=A0AAD6W996_9ROSI|nr:hypothetical protein NC653_009025 [Populus alba x Populus x berolinensis]
MLSSNILPDAIKFLALLSKCRHLRLVDERKRFFQLVSEENDMMRHCGCLVHLRCRADLLEEARDLIISYQASRDLITSHRLPKTSYNWTLLMAASLYEKAMEERNEVKKQRQEKIPGNSSIEIDGFFS